MGDALTRRALFRRLAIGGGALALPTAAYAGYVEPDRVVLTRIDVAIPGWPRELDGLRVGQITDTHCDCDHAVERAARAATLLAGAQPDVVFLTGDFVTVRASHWAAPAAEALKPLTSAPLGAFAVLGNHDWWAGGPHWMSRSLHRLGVRVLRNESALVGRGRRVCVVGLECMCERAAQLSQALRRAPREAPRLLMIHEPDYGAVAPPGFAMQFSGHSHGGQVQLPGLGALHTPVYAKIYRDHLERAPHHPVYVSRGVGVVRPGVRLFCSPEVNVVTLRSA